MSSANILYVVYCILDDVVEQTFMREGLGGEVLERASNADKFDNNCGDLPLVLD